MKLAMIMIRTGMYYETGEALRKAGLYSMSSMEIVGRGKKRVDFTMADSDVAQDPALNELVAKTMLEICVKDDQVDKLIEVVLSVNRKNNSGDGKIFIIPVEECLRIHTNEKGDDALV